MDFESLNNLYIIIAAKGASNVERYDGDLCVLDNDLDRGVKALYDNEKEPSSPSSSSADPTPRS
jgi:hypothetical protein